MNTEPKPSPYANPDEFAAREIINDVSIIAEMSEDQVNKLMKKRYTEGKDTNTLQISTVLQEFQKVIGKASPEAAKKIITDILNNHTIPALEEIFTKENFENLYVVKPIIDALANLHSKIEYAQALKEKNN